MSSDPAPHEGAGEAAPSIRLDHALQLLGVAQTGGHAKLLIQSGTVIVNGAPETRRKRQLVAGDIVDVEGESFEIAFEEQAEDDAPQGEGC